MVGCSRLVAAMLAGVLATLFAACGRTTRNTPAPGADGSGGRQSNVYVDMIRRTAVDKIDLLFMIDNSISMADKQQILAEAVPVLLSRLIEPPVVDGEPEFEPIRDIHVAVITSSLGAHGGQVCTDAAGNDHGRALGAVRAGLASWNNTGFLAWDPLGTKNVPPGTASQAAFVADFAAMVQATGENGCAYESSLEAWYRFLIDPEPVVDVAAVDLVSTPVDEGGLPCGADLSACLDEMVLVQRELFLRPDSLVAIVMLSDENDCSIRDHGLGWLAGTSEVGGRPFTMPRATSACASDPNDVCCRACNDNEPDGPPPGCSATGTDPECQRNGGVLDNSVFEDQLNLRCHEMKRRFGLDLVYPTSRYVEGLTAREVPSRSGGLVRNPLFAPSGDQPSRDPNLVFLVGIVGVPWQDIADDASLTGTGLRYLTADQFHYVEPNRWDVILGDPESNVPPADPFMIESPGERTGQNPVTGAIIRPSSAAIANAINGKEQTNIDSSDLQYACTFPLTTPRHCVTPECDCGPGTEGRNRSLCSQSGAGPVGNTQYHAKAYPGLRQLQVLKDFGPNALVASICPKNPSSADPANDPGYGYNPAMLALVDRLKHSFHRCTPRELTAVDDPETPEVDLKVTCTVLEAVRSADGCTCDGSRNRTAPQQSFVDAARKSAFEYGFCGAESLAACESFCVCEIGQLEGAELALCQGSVSVPPEVRGYCYVDADQGIGNPEIVAHCPPTSKRLLRFVGDDTPTNGAPAFIACTGTPLLIEQ